MPEAPSWQEPFIIPAGICDVLRTASPLLKTRVRVPTRIPVYLGERPCYYGYFAGPGATYRMDHGHSPKVYVQKLLRAEVYHLWVHWSNVVIQIGIRTIKDPAPFVKILLRLYALHDWDSTFLTGNTSRESTTDVASRKPTKALKNCSQNTPKGMSNNGPKTL